MHSFSIFDLFSLLCGLSMFLYGMQMGNKNLSRLGGSHIKKIIALITRHRLLAFVAGIGATVITQSSSATSVLLVGLASANMLTLRQSLGILLGADVGSSFTIQLMAFKFYYLAPFFIAAGYLLSLAPETKKTSLYGKLILAVGFIFFGMHYMGQAVEPLCTLPLFKKLIIQSLTNPVYGLMVGPLLRPSSKVAPAPLPFFWRFPLRSRRRERGSRASSIICRLSSARISAPASRRF